MRSFFDIFLNKKIHRKKSGAQNFRIRMAFI